jgi:hypothetical protein
MKTVSHLRHNWEAITGSTFVSLYTFYFQNYLVCVRVCCERNMSKN